MGYSTSAYVAYGVRIPLSPYVYDENERNVGEQVDQVLSVQTVKAACPDVGHMTAGAYDQHEFFLTTAFHEAGYEAQWVSDLADSSENQELSWERQLMHLIEVMGWTGLADSFQVGWFVVASTD